MRRRVCIIAALLSLGTLASACDPDSVRVAFRPPADARYRYVVDVRAEAETRIADREPRRSVDRFQLRVEHDVLRTGSESSTVEVRLEGEIGTEIGVRTFVARLDRAGQLAEVERIEGLPAEVLGELGISEIFPAAAAAPPDRPLSPGDRWTIDAPVDLPGLAPGRLRGRGRLTGLGVVEGREVATVESAVELTVPQGAVGQFLLGGTQSTTSTATHALADGAVQEVEAVTRGRFQLTVLPPSGTTGPAVPGSLVVEVRSHTRRVD